MAEHSETELTFRTLLEEASDGIVVFDDDGRFLEANPSLCSMLGYTRDEMLAMRADDIIDPADLAQEPIPWEVLRAGLVRVVERTFVRRDGGAIPVETKTRRMSNGRYLSIVRDITERRQVDRALAALREREEQLRQAQKIEAIGRLAGGVAHDFNNVLTAIMGYTDLLLDEFRADDPRRQDLGEIKKAAERAAALTRQLLAFSRKQVLQPILLDLNAIVGGVDKLVRRVVGDEIQVVFELASELGRVLADPGQLEQVLINLAVNARDAMPEGGRLKISTRDATIGEGDARRLAPLTPGAYVALEVADNGQGIEADVLPHIFEPFFTTKAQGKGTGLGLATVYGIVKQSNGFIFVTSTPGAGSVFTLYLPRDGAAAAPRVEATSQRVVLLVEDEAAVRSLTAGILRRQQLTVLEAPDATAALQAAATQHRIDLLLTDIVMPGGNGNELAERLQGERPGLKVIYMSGFSDERVRRAAEEHGIPFIQKPFTPHALVKVVNETLMTSP
ncbi:MAG TPA: ATP-binding protein [Vicinamibacterales bacterium]|nr:ATP-binding protein [Vicinamibacterales bacterium]